MSNMILICTWKICCLVIYIVIETIKPLMLVTEAPNLFCDKPPFFICNAASHVTLHRVGRLQQNNESRNQRDLESVLWKTCKRLHRKAGIIGITRLHWIYVVRGLFFGSFRVFYFDQGVAIWPRAALISSAHFSSSTAFHKNALPA